ncbi:MAG: hypothetical protein ACTHXA_02590 [Gulosibacter sp.]|uniref:hypothetical protein n=1 Tax=Gulosibacter sp. TaxID=2817531 RepID=UPI003F92AAF6
MDNALRQGLLFEDFSLGDAWVTPRQTVTGSDVADIAGLTGVPIETSPHGRQILPEAGVLAIATGLAWVRLGINEATAMAVLGMEEWEFVALVQVGDTIHVVQRVASLRESQSKRDRGVVKFSFAVRNQNDVICQQGIWVFLWSRKPSV